MSFTIWVSVNVFVTLFSAHSAESSVNARSIKKSSHCSEYVCVCELKFFFSAISTAVIMFTTRKLSFVILFFQVYHIFPLFIRMDDRGGWMNVNMWRWWKWFIWELDVLEQSSSFVRHLTHQHFFSHLQFFGFKYQHWNMMMIMLLNYMIMSWFQGRIQKFFEGGFQIFLYGWKNFRLGFGIFSRKNSRGH